MTGPVRHPFPQVTDTEGRQRALRAHLSLPCEARQGLNPWLLVRLEDLSARGFRAVWPNERIDPRLPLRLRIPGLQPLTARICWQDGIRIGAEFSAPLHTAVFDHVVASLGAARQG